MQKKSIITTLALLLVTLAAAAGTKTEVSKSFDAFSTLNILGSVDVVYTQGDSYSVRMVGDQEDIDRLNINQTGAQLNVGYKTTKIGGIYYSNSNGGDVTIYVTSPSVNVINLTGSASVKIDRLDQQTITLNVAGSGEMRLGKAQLTTASINVAGSGEVIADHLAATAVNLSVAGSGEVQAQVDCQAQLTCSVAGSGNVRVSGKAAHYTKSVFGSGSVDDDGLTAATVQSDSGWKQTDAKSRHQSNPVRGVVANP